MTGEAEVLRDFSGDLIYNIPKAKFYLLKGDYENVHPQVDSARHVLDRVSCVFCKVLPT